MKFTVCDENNGMRWLKSQESSVKDGKFNKHMQCSKMYTAKSH